MKRFSRAVDGSLVQIQVLETEDDLDSLYVWFRDRGASVGVDSETTGLDIFSDDYRIRTIQFGDANNGFVLPVERYAWAEDAATEIIDRAGELVIHNALFDLQVFDRCLGIKLEETYPKTVDTRILAHLIDPRGQEEGGIGHGLEALTAALVDEEVAEDIKGSMKALAKEHKTPMSKIWKLDDLLEIPDFLLYAGMDPVLAIRLRDKLMPLIPRSVTEHGLVQYEHRLALVCATMERTGVLLDVDYTQGLSDELCGEEEHWLDVLEPFGITSPASSEQVADALEERGVVIKGRTASGKRQVNKALLEQLISDADSPGHDIAVAVTEAKKARKWRNTWVDGFLLNKDEDDRVHPSINPLRARTARMSITGIPAQTLPSSDWKIRRCFIPDPGESLVSVDYKAQELRVLAALSGDPVMRKAFEADADLHQITADAAGVDRKVGKMANFLQVYGGGPSKLAENAGIPFLDARRVTEAFKATYPGVAQLAKTLEAEASATGRIITPTGRVLPVDPDRGYAAVNYAVQSTSRDVTCTGLLRLYDEGFGPNLRLPIHDEVLASVPIEHQEWGAQEIRRLMRMDFMGVDIDTDADVYGASWGAGYVGEDDLFDYEMTFQV